MRASIDGNGEHKDFSTSEVLAKEPGELTIPIRTIEETGEAIVLGFRQSMLTIGDIGSVEVGAGLGTDFIQLKWDGKTALVRGSELLKAWVATFAPEEAERFPEGVR
jgi:hypothetical protein